MPPHMHAYLETLLKERHVEAPIPSIAPNMIFHTSDTTFDEAAFRKSCCARSIPRMLLIPTLVNGIEDLLEVAKDCVENGF